MRAFLLAAGVGSRLRPLTNDIPKCLVSIQGKPLLQYWFDMLLDAGVAPLLVNLHYLPEPVRAMIASYPRQEQIVTVFEVELLNTGGSVLANLDFFGHDPFMLIHADNLSRFSVKDFISTHRNRPQGCEMTMMLFEAQNPEQAGVVEIDARGVVQDFHEKVANPPGNLANAAVYILEPSVLAYMKSLNKPKLDFSLDVIPNYKGRIATFLNQVYHRDIGTPESYRIAQVEYPGI